MLEEADVRRLHAAFPDLMLGPVRTVAVMNAMTAAMSIGVVGLFMATAIALLRSARHK